MCGRADFSSRRAERAGAAHRKNRVDDLWLLAGQAVEKGRDCVDLIIAEL